MLYTTKIEHPSHPPLPHRMVHGQIWPFRACKPATAGRLSLGPRRGLLQAGEGAEAEEEVLVGEGEERTEEEVGEHHHRHYPTQHQVPIDKVEKPASGISPLANPDGLDRAFKTAFKFRDRDNRWYTQMKLGC